VVDETWVWDGAVWTRMYPSTAPSGRHSPAMAYDAARQRVVLFGGWDGYTETGDTWEWDGTNWELRATTGPSPRVLHSMAYDPVRMRTVLFGGRDRNAWIYYTDTWEWDGTAWTLRATTGPGGRENGGMAFCNGRVMLFGGYRNTSYLSDTWEWNGSSWTQRAVSGPSARSGFAIASSDVPDRVVLFSGRTSYPVLNGETWQWDGTAWTQLCSTGPSAREASAMVYDPQAGFVLYGGSYQSDTWLFTDFLPQQPPNNLGELWYSGSAGEGVNTACGNYNHNETDFSVTTRGDALAFARSYNSLDASTSALGLGWTHCYNMQIDPNGPEGQVIVRWGDGHADYWRQLTPGVYRRSVPGSYDELVKNGDNNWTLTTVDEDVYCFDTSRRLTSITDKSGNVLSLTYHPTVPALLTAVTDGAGRALTLTYDGSNRLYRVTDFTGRYVEYTYTSGRLTQVRDVLGRFVHYGYDAHGYLATIQDQRGITTVTNTYHADGTGRVTEQRDANSNRTTFAYNTGPSSNQTQIRRWVTVGGVVRELLTTDTHEQEYKREQEFLDPLGHPVIFSYDAQYNRIGVTDRNGHRTSYTYDAKGNALTTTDPDDPADPNDAGVTTAEYNDATSPHNPTKKIDALGYVTEWTYDAQGNVLTEKRYLDLQQTTFVTKSWAYNSFGQRTSETDERGHTHTWIYDTQGLLTEEIDRGGNHTWYDYDALWRKIWVTDSRGSGPQDSAHTTSYTYDNDDQLLTVTGPPVGSPPHAIVVTYQYDEVGNRTQETDGNGNTTRSYYDGNNNLTRVEEPLEPTGRITRQLYDELNRKVATVDANGDTTRYTYDNGDRLLETRDQEGNTWTKTYDNQGNVLTEADPSGVTVTHQYDWLNRKTVMRDELANEWHYTYDKNGNLTTQTDPTGSITRFTYDGLRRLTTVTEAEGGVTIYSYDRTGNLTQIQDAEDQIISLREYDALNRLIKSTDGDGYFYEYGYDPVGNQAWVKDAKLLTDSLFYDAQSRLIRTEYADGTQVQNTYDDNGNRLTFTDPVGTTSFTYDELDRMRSSLDDYGKLVQYGYDPQGNRTALTYPDGKQVSYGYDRANRLTTVTDWASRTVQYGYQGMQLQTVTFPNGLIEHRGYDTAGRLLSLETKNGLNETILGFTWQRDGFGEPTSLDEQGTLAPQFGGQWTESYQYDADNRLEQMTRVDLSRGSLGADRSSVTSYEHDANGNLIQRTSGGQTLTFGYDREDRLVLQAGMDHSVTHIYDGQSYRIARVEDGIPTRYVLDRASPMSQVLCETDEAGTITAYYVLGPSILAQIGQDGTARYYHGNDLGNIVALSDLTGALTDRYAYGPFGEPAGKEGATPNEFTFVGALGVREEADGLYFMRARFYDPETGRFVSKDPLQGSPVNPAALHAYAYAGDQPVMMSDPAGLQPAGDPDSWRCYSETIDPTRLQPEEWRMNRLLSKESKPVDWRPLYAFVIALTGFGLIYEAPAIGTYVLWELGQGTAAAGAFLAKNSWTIASGVQDRINSPELPDPYATTKPSNSAPPSTNVIPTQAVAGPLVKDANRQWTSQGGSGMQNSGGFSMQPPTPKKSPPPSSDTSTKLTSAGSGSSGSKSSSNRTASPSKPSSATGTLKSANVPKIFALNPVLKSIMTKFQLWKR
jgi:RHS repeat-associated protein